MKIAAFIGIALVIFTCCKKDKDKITISGTLNDYATIQPVSGLQVEIQAQLVGTSTYQSSYTTLQTMASGSDGTFSFTFEEPRATSYRIRVYGTNYRATEHVFSPEQISAGSYSCNFRVPAYGWIMTKVINMPPVLPEDQMTIRYFNVPAGLIDACSSTQFHFQAGAGVNDTIPACYIPGGFTLVIEKNNGVMIQYDTVVIPVNDTLVHSVLY